MLLLENRKNETKKYGAWAPEGLQRLRDKLAAATARISQLEEADRQKEYALRHDRYLTTMLHKDEFLEVLRKKIESDGDKYIGLFFIDINNFKKFNDHNDHRAGDELLRYFETKVGEYFRRSGDDVAFIESDGGEVSDIQKGRMGGDEFALSVVFDDGDESTPRSSDPSEVMYALYSRLKELEAEMSEEFQHLMPEGVQLGLSIGSALYDPSHPLDAETIVRQADEAMYEEKPAGGR